MENFKVKTSDEKMVNDLAGVKYHIDNYLIGGVLVPFKDFVLRREHLTGEQKGEILKKIEIIVKDAQDLKKFAGEMMENTMNKYEKALSHISTTNIEDFEALQELVDKETPMKLIKFELDEYDDDISCYTWYCPRCNRFHMNDTKLDYCSYCGQRIDWNVAK